MTSSLRLVKTATATRTFHLFLDDDRAGNGSRPRLEVPDGVGYLVLPEDGQRPTCLAKTPRGRDAVVLEPLVAEREAYLLMLAPPRLALRVNGEGLRRVALLRERDLVQVPGTPWTLHVALHLGSEMGPPPAHLVGRPCPLCGTPFAGQTRIWICPACGTALHDEEGDGDDALQCLRLCSECPGCRGPLVKHGYRHLPEP